MRGDVPKGRLAQRNETLRFIYLCIYPHKSFRSNRRQRIRILWRNQELSLTFAFAFPVLADACIIPHFRRPATSKRWQPKRGRQRYYAARENGGTIKDKNLRFHFHTMDIIRMSLFGERSTLAVAAKTCGRRYMFGSSLVPCCRKYSPVHMRDIQHDTGNIWSRNEISTGCW